ncbi:hypothetical protein CPB84DRAFT_1795608 [Gymnopilus junonius]|uniref:Uncharacterized protein n=1 Tax=Gymnopilus junonius TaxID=109634 RepID=A0A9P5NAC2_GYMJU|nr:hypothetical protein CPB84DRAFT_1795608 [Gymnopilus junonius]
MATWLDFVSLFATITVIGGIVYAVLYVVRSVNDGLASTKASLKTKGLDISSSGVSIKTSKRFDREHYVDATQRGIVKAIGAASFRKNGAASHNVSGVPPSMERHTSSTSAGSSDSTEKKKKRFAFGKK